MLHLIDGMKLEDLDGYTLVVPAIAIVNSSQLAMDVLIASKKMKRIGQFTHLGLVPVYGPSAFTHCPGERTTAVELYALPQEKLLAVQFRSIMVFKHAGTFHRDMAITFKKAQIRRVVILSNIMCFGGKGDDALWYKATDAFFSMHKEDFKAVTWEKYKGLELMGGGSDVLLFKAFERQNIPVMIYYRGIGTPEAAVKDAAVLQQVTQLLVDFLKIGEKFELSLPIAWHNQIGTEGGIMMY